MRKHAASVVRVSFMAAMSCGLALTLSACRGDKETDRPDAPPVPGSATIYKIQSGEIPAGTVVELTGVIVTAVDTYGARTGNFWVQEAAGGEHSGVLVFGVSLDQVAQLVVGDTVTIAGAEVIEFALMSDTSGRTTTELQAPEGGVITVTKTASGATVMPAEVDPLAIAMLPEADRDAEWEKWEGVLVRVQSASGITQTSNVSAIGSDEAFREFRISGGLRIDESLSMFPEGLAVDGCLSSITGIGDYFFNYKVLPRESSEVAVDAAGTCPQENSMAACQDGMDNDLDGFMDCMDVGCQGDPAFGCQTATNIQAIQNEEVTGAVTLNDVVVTAVSFNRKNLWLSDSATAAPGQGIFVFRGSAAAELPAEVVAGAIVDVTGNVTEFNNDANGTTLTQLAGSNVAVTFVAAGPAPTPLAANGTLTTMVDATMGEPYESTLVTLQDVTVATAADMANFYVGEMSASGVTFLFDDDILRVTQPAGTCFGAITGIWTYQVFENAFAFLPISVVDEGTCSQ